MVMTNKGFPKRFLSNLMELTEPWLMSPFISGVISPLGEAWLGSLTKPLSGIFSTSIWNRNGELQVNVVSATGPLMVTNVSGTANITLGYDPSDFELDEDDGKFQLVENTYEGVGAIKVRTSESADWSDFILDGLDLSIPKLRVFKLKTSSFFSQTNDTLSVAPRTPGCIPFYTTTATPLDVNTLFKYDGAETMSCPYIKVTPTLTLQDDYVTSRKYVSQFIQSAAGSGIDIENEIAGSNRRNVKLRIEPAMFTVNASNNLDIITTYTLPMKMTKTASTSVVSLSYDNITIGNSTLNTLECKTTYTLPLKITKGASSSAISIGLDNVTLGTNASNNLAALYTFVAPMKLTTAAISIDYDGVTIGKDGVTNKLKSLLTFATTDGLSLTSAAVKNLHTYTSPLVMTNNVIALQYEPTTMEILAGKLSAKAPLVNNVTIGWDLNGKLRGLYSFGLGLQVGATADQVSALFQTTEYPLRLNAGLLKLYYDNTLITDGAGNLSVKPILVDNYTIIRRNDATFQDGALKVNFQSGTGILIYGNTISGTYSAGTGLLLTGTVFSLDPSIQSQITTHGGRITALEGRVTAHDALISTLQGQMIGALSSIGVLTTGLAANVAATVAAAGTASTALATGVANTAALGVLDGVVTILGATSAAHTAGISALGVTTSVLTTGLAAAVTNIGVLDVATTTLTAVGVTHSAAIVTLTTGLSAVVLESSLSTAGLIVTNAAVAALSTAQGITAASLTTNIAATGVLTGNVGIIDATLGTNIAATVANTTAIGLLTTGLASTTTLASAAAGTASSAMALAGTAQGTAVSAAAAAASCQASIAGTDVVVAAHTIAIGLLGLGSVGGGSSIQGQINDCYHYISEIQLGNINAGRILTEEKAAVTYMAAQPKFIEMGDQNSDNTSYLDFHSSANTDFNARIIRYPGFNGGFELGNVGGGNMTLLATNILLNGINSNTWIDVGVGNLTNYHTKTVSDGKYALQTTVTALYSNQYLDNQFALRPTQNNIDTQLALWVTKTWLSTYNFTKIESDSRYVLQGASQPSITSVGTLTSLNVSGASTCGGGINAIQTHASATTVNPLVTRFDVNWGMRLVQNYAGANDIYYQWYNTYNITERMWLSVRGDTTTLASPVVIISSATDSSSSITGAAQFLGGVGIAKKLYVGTQIYMANALVATQSYVTGLGYETTTSLTTKLSLKQDLITVSAPLTKTGVNLAIDLSAYDTTASLTTKLATKESVLTVSSPLVRTTNVISLNSSLITSLGTLTALSSSGVVSITNTTASTSSTTGALLVSGGAYIAGRCNVGTSIYLAGADITTLYTPTGYSYSKAQMDTSLTAKQDVMSAGYGLYKSGATLNNDTNVMAERSWVSTLVSGYQPSLSAGEGLSISSNVISLNTNAVVSTLQAVSGSPPISQGAYIFWNYIGSQSVNGCLEIVNSKGLGGGDIVFYQTPSQTTPVYTELFRMKAGSAYIGSNKVATEIYVTSALSTYLTTSAGDGKYMPSWPNFIEMGSDTGDSNCLIDLHSSAGVDYSARIIRRPGVNGIFELSQTGAGDMALYASNILLNGVNSNTYVTNSSLASTLAGKNYVTYSGANAGDVLILNEKLEVGRAYYLPVKLTDHQLVIRAQEADGVSKRGASLFAYFQNPQYPAYQLSAYSRDNVFLAFDNYHDGTDFRAGHPTPGWLYKINGKLNIDYAGPFWVDGAGGTQKVTNKMTALSVNLTTGYTTIADHEFIPGTIRVGKFGTGSRYAVIEFFSGNAASGRDAYIGRRGGSTQVATPGTLEYSNPQGLDYLPWDFNSSWPSGWVAQHTFFESVKVNNCLMVSGYYSFSTNATNGWAYTRTGSGQSIASTPASNFNIGLIVDQNIVCRNSVICISDERVKKDIQVIRPGHGLKCLERIDPCHYTMRESGEEKYGFISQNVSKTLSEAVKEFGGQQHLDYNQMISVLWSAVRDLKAEVDALRSELNSFHKS